MAKAVEQQIEALRDELRHHEHLYYVLDTPEISDPEYDSLMNRLKAFEARFVNKTLVGDVLTCTAQVTARDAGRAELELSFRDQRGEEKLRGHASVACG